MTFDPQDAKRLEELKAAEIRRLETLPYFPSMPDDPLDKGVLLSDRIKHYCKKYKLIDPFDENDLLKPAGYDLTVGYNASIRGERIALNENSPSLKIGPYEVAIIETQETLNMPAFLIGRWNIRVQRAYEGLLWVGGAQVDPGFRGRLCCPIYNLSNKTVPLRFGEKLAMIDFVTTTPYNDFESLSFRWPNRKLLVFQDYPTLHSGIQNKVDEFEETLARDKAETDDKLTKATLDATESFHRFQTRIDTFVTLVFGVIALLFTTLGIVVSTRGSAPGSAWNPPVWLSGAALFFALVAYARTYKPETSTHRWLTRLATGVLVAILVTVMAGVAIDGYYEQRMRSEFDNLRQRIERMERTQMPSSPPAAHAPNVGR